MKKKFFLLLIGLCVMSLQTFASDVIIETNSDSKTYTTTDNSSIKSGTVTWDKTTKTVTLDNVSISITAFGESFLITGNGDVRVMLKGNNVIKSSDYVAFYYQSSGDLTITSEDGKGTLTCQGEKGLYVNYPTSNLLVINCKLTATGTDGAGISGDGWNKECFKYLTIDNANVVAKGTAGDRNYGSINWCENIMLVNCYYAAPKGVYFKTINVNIDGTNCSVGGLTTDGSTFTKEEVVIKTRSIDDIFPDVNFRTYVKSNFDFNSDGFLGEDEATAVTKIDFSAAGIKNVKDLTGIEIFTELKELNCRSNDLSMGIDLSANTKLEKLNLYDCKLHAIDVTMLPGLTNLNLGNNKLTSLDVSNNNKLTFLDFYFNDGITSIDLSNLTELDYLHTYGTPIGTLDLSNNTKLTYLSCPKCKLTTLDVSMLPLLEYISFGQNDFTSLNLSKNTKLEKVDGASSPNLESVNLSACTMLQKVDLSNCKLTELQLPATCPNLTSLLIYVNNIKGEAMKNLVDKLPTVTAGKMYAVNPYSPNEGNVITSVQVGKANAKGWTVYYNNNSSSGYTWEVYGGSSPGIAIDATNFPDEKFRTALKARRYDDDQDGYLSEEELATTTLMQVNELGISDLTGVEHFTALKYLHCYNNNLTSINVSALTNLELLYCMGNQLTSLDVSQNTKLVDLGCNSNKLTSLVLDNNPQLVNLSCQENQLTALDVTNNVNLKNLRCGSNHLSALNLTKNTQLVSLECYDNELTALDLSKNTAMRSLDCSYNKLTSLDLSNLAEGIDDIDVYFGCNQIGETAMQTLVESLPTVVNGGLYAIEISEPTEQNVINTLQVALAKSKNWVVMTFDGSDYVQYEGTVPAGITTIKQDAATDGHYYSLDGRRVEQPTKGVYILNGRKVVVK